MKNINTDQIIGPIFGAGIRIVPVTITAVLLLQEKLINFWWSLFGRYMNDVDKELSLPYISPNFINVSYNKEVLQ